jgi:hypothetical protein
MTQELIDVIKKVKERITDNSDMVWTSYDSAKELRNELERYIEELQTGDIRCIEKLQMFFLPTASLQEHSISNGWTDEYMRLSENFDRLYVAKKNHS